MVITRAVRSCLWPSMAGILPRRSATSHFAQGFPSPISSKYCSPSRGLGSCVLSVASVEVTYWLDRPRS